MKNIMKLSNKWFIAILTSALMIISAPTAAQIEMDEFKDYRQRVKVYPGAFINDPNDPEDVDNFALDTLFLPAGGSIEATCPNVADVNIRPLDQPHFVLDVVEPTKLALTASALPFTQTELVIFLISQDGSYAKCVDRAENEWNVDTAPELVDVLPTGTYGVWVAVEKFAPEQTPNFGLLLQILTP
jgi:hypothetical protein